MKHIFILAISILFLSCGNNQVEITNDEGTVVERFQFLEDSIKHGSYEAFYNDGKIKEKSNYKNGNLEGQRTIYYGNGNVEIEENYVNNILDGVFKAYWENGKLNIEVDYKKGQMNGPLKRYYDTGSLQEEMIMKDGQENGPFKEYFANGQVEWEGAYKNGDNEEGLLVQYEEDGSVLKKMECNSGVCRTIWTKKDGDITSDN